MGLAQTEVDGVTTLVAASGGPLRAGLVFRVGRADEVLARSGVTHLVGHLVLGGCLSRHRSAVTTTFQTAGSEDDVVGFLIRVCAGLTALALERLETEKAVIRTEWSSGALPSPDPMPAWRYGARGYGLLSYAEPGLPGVTADDVREWCGTWFTRENAVLWIAGAGAGVPAGLRLALSAGERKPVPRAISVLPATPAYLAEGHHRIAYETVVAARPAATVYGDVLGRALVRELGPSVVVSSTVDSRGDGAATVRATVEAPPSAAGAVLGGVVDALAKLRVGRVDLPPGSPPVDVEPAAFDLLTVGRLPYPGTVTAADVHAVAMEGARTALLQVPAGHRAEWAGFLPAPVHSRYRVLGATYPPVTPGGPDVVVGPDGVTSVRDGMATTVRFEEVAAMLAWPDGGRRLIGNDGFLVEVEPTLNPVDPAAIAAIDAAVTPARTIRLPAREQVSTSRPPIPPPVRPVRPGAIAGWEIAVILLSLVPALAMLVWSALVSMVATSDNGGPDDIGWAVPLASWLCTATVGAPAVVLIVRRFRLWRMGR